MAGVWKRIRKGRPCFRSALCLEQVAGFLPAPSQNYLCKFVADRTSLPSNPPGLTDEILDSFVRIRSCWDSHAFAQLRRQKVRYVSVLNPAKLDFRTTFFAGCSFVEQPCAHWLSPLDVAVENYGKLYAK